ncbi:GNAT family N-acetyltransferase [Klenkia sp. LSe6-5]|uniref:GNAT family N-acetyltransferase n=1 Tax=Klenkia sesuvii TaxID=3103137 RepID=A0ABU8DRB3_9ACTN
MQAWIAAAPDPIAAPLSARFLTALADETGVEPGVVDAVLVAPAAPVAPAIPLQPLHRPGHLRVQRAHRHRTDVQVLGTPGGAAVLSLGRGLCGRWEVSIEVDPAARGRGLGTALAAAAPALVDGPLWAQVAPANTASMRSFLAAGYRVVCAESLFGS